MDETAAKPAREERLAAKLRENLRRRKAQGRELVGAEADPASKVGPKPGLSKPEGRG